jgi:hypothetical protein
MFVNYFWQQCVIGIRDALGHLAGLLCIKFREDILIINVAWPVLLEFAELADSSIYPPSSISPDSEKSHNAIISKCISLLVDFSAHD